MSEMKVARCTDCSAEFTQEEMTGAKACPECGTASMPMSIAQDITIKINWHEIRILTMWASNWAERLTGEGADQSRKMLSSLLKRIDKCRPEGGGSLTIVEEVKELQRAFPGAVLKRGDEVIVPAKPFYLHDPLVAEALRQRGPDDVFLIDCQCGATNYDNQGQRASCHRCKKSLDDSIGDAYTVSDAIMRDAENGE